MVDGGHHRCSGEVAIGDDIVVMMMLPVISNCKLTIVSSIFLKKAHLLVWCLGSMFVIVGGHAVTVRLQWVVDGL